MPLLVSQKVPEGKRRKTGIEGEKIKELGLQIHVVVGQIQEPLLFFFFLGLHLEMP